MPTQYAIKDLERLSGIKAHTLRIWEQRYGILKPERTDTNIRYYTGEDLKRILNISLLNNNGFKISKIAKLPDEEIIKQVQSILNNYTKENDQIDNLVLCMLEMNEPKFEKIVSNCIIHFGFESTIEKIIFPFMRQIGNMWLMGTINPAQEHFISHLVRQKIIVGIDGLFPEPLANPKTFLLYLPTNELHELGLLYCNFLVKAKGHKC
jgi:DNA-binding transcriptional MerR regulator